MIIHFDKYHGLGNDYIVIDRAGFDIRLAPELARRICDRHYGVGSDGILVGPQISDRADFGLLIFNPDGSQAEKSGNGLRIFSRHLWDCGQVGEAQFSIETPGGLVHSQILMRGEMVRVEMGAASFDNQDIPMSGPRREVIDEIMELGDRTVKFCAVSLGNPHCVVFDATQVSREIACHLGPLIENHPLFPRRINVQFLKVLDRSNLQIEIWERGVGYTLASGSSSCAAAAAAYRMGMCDPAVKVHVPGGILEVEIAPDGQLVLTGPVVKVCEGKFYWN